MIISERNVGKYRRWPGAFRLEFIKDGKNEGRIASGCPMNADVVFGLTRTSDERGCFIKDFKALFTILFRERELKSSHDQSWACKTENLCGGGCSRTSWLLRFKISPRNPEVGMMFAWDLESSSFGNSLSVSHLDYPPSTFGLHRSLFHFSVCCALLLHPRYCSMM